MAGLGKTLAHGFTNATVWLYRRSGGRIGGRMFGGPVLLLSTTGRKSGRTWTTPLIYQADADRFVIIASNGGRPRHPAWWLNLRSNPDATIQVGPEVIPVTAHAVTGAERDRLWALMTKVYPGYDNYQKKTTRKIPVVLLDRR
jgi:deazaflavin-dependent oxidoreductase (nitroreductase family)